MNAPATGAADRVELPVNAHALGHDAMAAFQRAYWAHAQHHGFYESFAVGWTALINAAALNPPSSSAGAAGLEEVERLARKMYAARPSMIWSPARREMSWEEVSSDVHKEFLKDAEVALADFNATIARQADDLERLRKLDEALAGLRALSERATPGEWRVETDTTLVWGDCIVDDDGYVERMGVPVLDAQQARGWSKDGQPDPERAQCNAALSAAAVNLVRAQIARPSADQREGADDGGGRP